MKKRNFIITKFVSIMLLIVLFSTFGADAVKAMQTINLKEIKILMQNQVIETGMTGELSLSAISEDNSIKQVTTGVKFKSTNEKVIKITEHNKFKATGQGFTLIKARYGDKETSLFVYVAEPEKEEASLAKDGQKVEIKYSRDLSKIYLEWTATDELKTYSILRRSSKETEYKEVAVNCEGNSFIDKDVKLDEEYTYKVKLFDINKKEYELNEVIVPVNKAILDLMNSNKDLYKSMNQEDIQNSLLQQLMNSLKEKRKNSISLKWIINGDGLNLIWTATDQYKKFSILRREENESDFTKIASNQEGNEYLDKTIEDNKNYVYKIILIDQNLQERPLNEIFVDTSKASKTKWHKLKDKEQDSKTNTKAEDKNKKPADVSTEDKKEIDTDEFEINKAIEISDDIVKAKKKVTLRYRVDKNSKIDERKLTVYRKQADGTYVQVKGVKVDTKNKVIKFKAKEGGTFIINPKPDKKKDKNNKENNVDSKDTSAVDDFKVTLAGLLSNSVASLSKEDILKYENKVPNENGIWVPETDREYIEATINSITSKTYFVDEKGYLRENLKEPENAERPRIYSNILDSIIKNERVILGRDAGIETYDNNKNNYKKVEFKDSNSKVVVDDANKAKVIVLNNKYFIKDDKSLDKKAYEIFDLLKVSSTTHEKVTQTSNSTEVQNNKDTNKDNGSISDTNTNKDSGSVSNNISKDKSSNSNANVDINKDVDAEMDTDIDTDVDPQVFPDAKSVIAYMSEETSVYYGPNSSKYVGNGQVSKNENVTVLGSEDNWYYVEFSTADGAERGYVEQSKVESYLNINPNDIRKHSYTPRDFSVISNVNIYSGPDSYYKTIDNLKAGEKVTVLDDIYHSFYYIEYSTSSGKKRGYAGKNHLKEVVKNGIYPSMFMTSMIAVDGGSYANAKVTASTSVYAGPSSSTYANIGSVDAGESIIIWAKDNGWCFIDYYVGNASNNIHKRGFIPISCVSNVDRVGNLSLTGKSDVGGSEILVYCAPQQGDYYKNNPIGRIFQNERATVFNDEATVGGTTFVYVEFSSPSGTKRGYANKAQFRGWQKGILATANSSPSTYAGPGDYYSYANIGSLDYHEYVIILAQSSDWFYVEYNTRSNRKRGYVKRSQIDPKQSLSSIPGIMTSGSAACSRISQTTYAGPSNQFAKMGSVDANEGVKIFALEDDDYYYIEYGTDSGLKRGYVPCAQTYRVASVEIPNLSVSGATYESYGTSGNGRDLYAYRIGNGSKVMVMTFEVHGFEDAWSRDGIELVKIAGKVIQDLASYSNDNGGLNGWTVYIIRSVNPDGLIDGYTNNGPGRCTVNQRIDLNRTFPTDFQSFISSRNNTGGSTPLAAPEAKSLYDFITKKNPDIMIDVHGWENSTLGNAEISKYFQDQLGLIHKDTYQQGSVTDWAKTLKGGTTKSVLVELPWPNSSQDIANRGFAQKVSNATLNIIKKDAPPARLVIDTPSENQNVTSDFIVSGWTLNQSGIKELKIYIDGKYYTSLRVNVPRLDVAKVYPQYRYVATCGYEGKININDLSNGTHSIGVGSIGNDGVELNYHRTVIVNKLGAKLIIDAPSENQNVSGDFIVRGWTVNQSGIKELKIYIDGKYYTSLNVNVSRPDVAKVYPQYNNVATCGYECKININDLSDGTHSIGVGSIGNDGVELNYHRTVIVKKSDFYRQSNGDVIFKKDNQVFWYLKEKATDEEMKQALINHGYTQERVTQVVNQGTLRLAYYNLINNHNMNINLSQAEYAFLYMYNRYGTQYMFHTKNLNGYVGTRDMEKKVFKIIFGREPKYYSLLDGSWKENTSGADRSYTEADAVIGIEDVPVTLQELVTGSIIGMALVVGGSELSILTEGIKAFGWLDGIWLYTCGAMPQALSIINGITPEKVEKIQKVIEEDVTAIESISLDLESDSQEINAIITSDINAVTKGSIQVGETTRVGQWMSKAEYEQFLKTGEIPRTNVLTKGKEGYIKQANIGDYYVEFDIDSSLLVEKDIANGWALVKSKNNIYKKLAEKKGQVLPEPIGTNIKQMDIKK